jgi:alcohol dehydrogenase class IV
MPSPTITYLADVYFEAGAARHVPEVLRKHGMSRPLIVTDSGVITAGVVERLQSAPREAVFSGVDPNPTEENVEHGLGLYRERGCDGVLAVGGGSPIDCAKAIALLVTHGPPLEQYAFLRGGLDRITEGKPPVIAVPTTAGTGSEVGRGALITFRSGRKLAILSPKLIPQAAVCDPELTLSLSPLLTAATGMDAVSHCVETFMSPRFNPVADAIALDGLRRAAEWIRRAVRDGPDIEARSEMLMAALEGGLTFQKGLGAIHSLSHALGALSHRRLHHGTLNSVFLPHVLRFNAEGCEAKLRRLADVLSLSSGGAVPAFFEGLARELGLPPRLRDLGVPWDEAESCTQAAFDDHCGATNPRPLSLEASRDLLRVAW